MKTLFRNASVVFPSGVAIASVLVDGDKIVSIDAPPHASADRRIDATGLHLMPGVIDDQVHFREPGLTHKEDLEHATRACAAGGVTTFLEMPNTRPPAISADAVRDKEHLAALKSLVNYGFYIGATADNIEALQSIDGVPGIKIFIGSSTGDLLVDEQAALERIFAETTLPICAHCEDESTVRAGAARYAGTNDVADHSRIRSAEAALIATRRAVDLARRHQHRFHVLHVSVGAEVDLFADAAPLVTAEACPHHLLFSVDDYPRLGSLVQMNPSLKTKADNQRLWQALIDGQIQVIATDHAPHLLEEKRQPYPQSPSGLPAVENSLALILDQVVAGRFGIERVAQWMSDAPARVWGIVGKGRIEVGYDADLVLVDLNQTRTVRNAQQYTKAGWSPWDGQSFTGWPVGTWVGGRQVYDRGRLDETVRGAKPLFDHARGGYWATPDGVGTR